MTREFNFINFFRATAAFWVLFAHCMIWGGWHGIPVPSPKIAVDIFMLISGYLMAATTTARNHLEPLSNSRNWLRFWLKRFFRIAPAYYLSLGLAVFSGTYFLAGYQELQNLNPTLWPAGGVYDPSKIEYTLQNILLHISFLFGLHPKYSFSTFLPDWSLSLEMQFYFAFPFLFLVMQKFGFVRTAVLVGIPIFILGFGITRLVKYHEPSLLIFKLNYFLAGIILFLFLTSGTTRRKRIASASAAILLVSVDLRYREQLVALPALMILMLYLGKLEVSNKTPKWLSLFFNSRTVRFASDTSYGVYLFHGFFISGSGIILSTHSDLILLPPQQRFALILTFVTALSYLLAYAIYRLVELPGIRLGKNITEIVAPVSTKHSSPHETETESNRSTSSI